MSSSASGFIEFKGVHKVYNSGVHALKDANIRIEKGEFVFVVGETGAGKSTFLKLIMREEIPTAGEVIVNNNNLSKIRRKHIPYLRRTMGVVFQDFRLIDKMTAYENVAFAMRVVGTPARAIRKRVPYVLGLVGLAEKQRSYPPELSGGEQQRVALARALVNNPSIIIADEPTGNVDPKKSYEIMNLLDEINKKGTTVIVVTHALDLVKRFPHRVIRISDGEIVADIPDPNYVPSAGPSEETSIEETAEPETVEEVQEEIPADDVEAETAEPEEDVTGGAAE